MFLKNFNFNERLINLKIIKENCTKIFHQFYESQMKMTENEVLFSTLNLIITSLKFKESHKLELIQHKVSVLNY
jgi:hypothetical protein